MITKGQITVLILTLICFLAWLISDLIRSPSSFTPTQELTKALTPLDPTFNLTALDLVNQTTIEILPVNKTTQKTPQ